MLDELPKMDSKCLRSLWVQLSTLIVVVLVYSVADTVRNGPGRQEPVNWLVVIGAALTVFAFAVGDTGVHGTTVALQVHPRCRPVRDVATKYMVLDVLFTAAHAVILAVAAWFCAHDPDRYFEVMFYLACVNIAWLVMKIAQFVEAKDLCRDDAALAACLGDSVRAMLAWIALNMLYSLTCYAATRRLTHDPGAAHQWCVYLTLLRSLADLLVCRGYYTRVLCGELPPEDLRRRRPPRRPRREVFGRRG